MNSSNQHRLLIADDSYDLLEILQIFFKNKGYIVKTVLDSEAIYGCVSSFKPDVLLLDIFLNGADGREVCKKIRRHADGNALGIIIFSASPDLLAEYKKCQADDYIEKPFDLDKIAEKVASLLSWKPLRKEAIAGIQ